MTEESLIQYPCDFPIKIIGVNTPGFNTRIFEIVTRHFINYAETTAIQKPSKDGNYLAITVTVFAENKDMLDAFYREISQHPEVKMVL
jgi:putative lipoic acid-binding regulatory protein